MDIVLQWGDIVIQWTFTSPTGVLIRVLTPADSIGINLIERHNITQHRLLINTNEFAFGIFFSILKIWEREKENEMFLLVYI